MRRTFFFTCFLLTALDAEFPAVLQAMPLNWISTSIDHQTQNVLFTLQFSAVPNLHVGDQFNRQQDSFQIYIFDRPRQDIVHQPQPDGGAILRSVVRGEEIHLGGGLPIRDALPIVFDPISGGWGSTVTTVPFVQLGQTLSFSTSLSTLRLKANSAFGFGFETFHFGAWEGPELSNFRCVSGKVCSVPIPDMLWPTLAGMFGIAVFAERKGRAQMKLRG
jgi:hypothetical protein